MEDNKKKENIDPSVISKLLNIIKQLTEVAQLSMLEEKLDSLNNQISEITGVSQENKPSLKEAIDSLSEFATNKIDPKTNSRVFLLHRISQDFEYENSASENNIYETSNDTDWIAEIEAAESGQRHKNPVVSCLIPESSIKSIAGAQANTGTWGELGTNPNATKYRIIVKPGKYQIHQELRQ